MRHGGVYAGYRGGRNGADDWRSGDLHGGGGDVGRSVVSGCGLLKVKGNGEVGGGGRV